MIEVDNLGITTHTHLILLHAFKQIFITKFLTKFQKNKVWKNRLLEKQVFGKMVFSLEKEFLLKYSSNFISVDL